MFAARFVRVIALGCALAALCLACAAMETRPAAAREASVTIHVVSHGWHTGIVVRRADVALGAWPEVDDFARAEYLEVGWGDRAYYQKLDPGVGDALAAVLVPGPSVLHIVGFRGPVRQVFPASEVIALSITPGQLAELLAFVRSAYARDASGRPLPLGPGLYGDSRFYAAVERFHLFHNCNVWTARALQAAGVPVGSDLTAGGVMSEVRRVAAGRGAP